MGTVTNILTLAHYYSISSGGSRNVLSQLGANERPIPGAPCVDFEPRWDVLTRRVEMGRSYAPSRDGTFLRAESRWDVLTRRAERRLSYTPSGDRTFLLPPDDLYSP